MSSKVNRFGCSEPIFRQMVIHYISCKIGIESNEKLADILTRTLPGDESMQVDVLRDLLKLAHAHL